MPIIEEATLTNQKTSTYIGVSEEHGVSDPWRSVDIYHVPCIPCCSLLSLFVLTAPHFANTSAG